MFELLWPYLDGRNTITRHLKISKLHPSMFGTTTRLEFLSSKLKILTFMWTHGLSFVETDANFSFICPNNFSGRVSCKIMMFIFVLIDGTNSITQICIGY